MENEKKSGGDKYSKLAGNTLIFAISSFSSKLLTLIVQPFLTYAMAEISDLGLSKILSQYANLLIPFVSMGMSNAIIRFGLDKGNSEKQVFTNGLLTILGGFGILVLCWPIARFLPDMAQYGLLIYLYVADGAGAVEHPAVLPGDAHVPAGLFQLADGLAVGLAPAGAVLEQHKCDVPGLYRRPSATARRCSARVSCRSTCRQGRVSSLRVNRQVGAGGKGKLSGWNHSGG